RLDLVLSSPLPPAGPQRLKHRSFQFRSVSTSRSVSIACSIALSRWNSARAARISPASTQARPWESSLATPERGHGDVSLLLLDAGVADHPGPALRLFLLELRHVRRAAATGQLPVSFLDVRLVERRVNGPVELGNDGSRCFRWRADGVPGIRE